MRRLVCGKARRTDFPAKALQVFGSAMQRSFDRMSPADRLRHRAALQDLVEAWQKSAPTARVR